MIAKIRVRYILRCLFFLFTDKAWFRRTVVKSTGNLNMLIVHTDAIGDYILFRNFIQEIRKSQRFAGYKITLLANSAYQDLAKELDSGIVDEFIWFNRTSFNFDRTYRKKVLNELSHVQYEIAINPTYSRDFPFADSMIRCVSATNKVGQKGNTASGYWFLNKISSMWYTKLVDTGAAVQFEFERTRKFVEALIGEPLALHAPYLPKPMDIKRLPHIILFPGAGEKQKQWPVEHFAGCVQAVNGNHQYQIYVCGGPGDFGLGEQIKQLNPGVTIENLCGKTSLMELCKLIGEATLLITNDSSAIHFAACMGTPSICVGNGRHYSRFTPYPGEAHTHLHFLFPEIVERMAKADLDKLQRLTAHSGIARIEDVTLERVVAVMHQILKHESSTAR